MGTYTGDKRDVVRARVPGNLATKARLAASKRGLTLSEVVRFALASQLGHIGGERIGEGSQ